jgi:hypothetical protein
MKENYRAGSEGAAQSKASFRWFLVATVISVVVYSLFFFQIFDTNFFHGYYRRAAFGWKVAAIVSIAFWYFFMFFKSAYIHAGAGDKGTPAFILFGWFALNLGALAGWNFDLNGIG